jgi:ferric-chelate reductase (NADPH)
VGITARLKDMAEAALLTEAEVTGVDDVGEDFVRIGLGSPALRAVRWTAGTKVQIRMAGDGWSMRTYTPLNWDVADGRTELLAYRHGHGPAGIWSGQVAAGDGIRFMGPRRSIDAPGAVLGGRARRAGLTRRMCSCAGSADPGSRRIARRG